MRRHNMTVDDIIKKINRLDDDRVDDEVAEIELSLELEEMMDVNSKAIELMGSKEICTMLKIPYSEADKVNHYRRLQLYAYYLKEEGR
jgi:hypothetical protein